jgi:hypothetical protein
LNDNISDCETINGALISTRDAKTPQIEILNDNISGLEDE